MQSLHPNTVLKLTEPVEYDLNLRDGAEAPARLIGWAGKNKFTIASDIDHPSVVSFVKCPDT